MTSRDRYDFKKNDVDIVQSFFQIETISLCEYENYLTLCIKSDNGLCFNIELGSNDR